LLGLSYFFQDEIKNLGIKSILILAMIILFAGFTYLIIIKITEFENSLIYMEEKFIRQKELEEIRTEIKSINKLINNKK